MTGVGLEVAAVLVFSSYLGGSASDNIFTFPAGVAVDPAGGIYVTSGTNSPDFPTTPGAVQPAFAGATDAQVTKVIELVNAKRISELTPSAVQTAIGVIREAGASLQTCHHYIRAIKQFSRWLIRDGRVSTDALAYLRGFNAATDPRHLNAV